ncbi:MAG: hypothetical protein JW388_0512 [Nitrospira sp.]|nr:hypothetical protein [Nitrospira sp.]
MTSACMRHGSQQRELIGDFGMTRQQLRQSDARHFGGDGLEWAAEFNRRFGFGIECIQMRTAAAQPNQNDSRLRWFFRRLRA